VLRSIDGERTLSAEEYFVGPAVDIENTTALRTGEILTAVRLPKAWANATFYYEKVADRNVWDFSLVNVAAAFQVENGTIQESRVVCGGVQATPKRLRSVEQAVQGKAKGAVIAASVAGIASEGARALAHNGFKIPLMENLVKRAISA